MEQPKINKIALIALIFALLALTQAGAITNALNYTFHAGNNITIIDDGLGNVTISSNVSVNNYYNGTAGSDNLKVNKSGDTMSGNLYLGHNSIYDVISFDGENVDVFDVYTQTISNYYDDDIIIHNSINMTGHNITNCGNCQGLNGTNGSNGNDGLNGMNGVNGTNGLDGSNGLDGTDGTDGLNGTNGINQSDTTKVNKTGDIFINNSLTTQVTILKTDDTSGIAIDNPSGAAHATLLMSGISPYGGVIGGTQIGGGTFINPLPTKSGTMFFFYARGYSNLSGYTTSRAGMLVSAVQDWTNTSNPTTISFSNTPIGSTTRANYMILNDTGRLQLPNLMASSQSNALCYNAITGDITYNSGLTTCLASTESTKTNLTNISISLIDSVMKLNPKTYNSKLDNSLNYGFSAQELEKEYPDLVGFEILYDTKIIDGTIIKSNPHKGNITGVKYENMVAVLTKVIQEQEVKIESQQKIINNICFKNPMLCA